MCVRVLVLQYNQEPPYLSWPSRLGYMPPGAILKNITKTTPWGARAVPWAHLVMHVAENVVNRHLTCNQSM